MSFLFCNNVNYAKIFGMKSKELMKRIFIYNLKLNKNINSKYIGARDSSLYILWSYKNYFNLYFSK